MEKTEKQEKEAPKFSGKLASAPALPRALAGEGIKPQLISNEAKDEPFNGTKYNLVNTSVFI